MISVRVKLLGLVLGGFVPALVGAILSERAAERELLEEAGLHIKAVGRHFDELLDDYEKHALLAVTFAAHDKDFHQAMSDGNQDAVQSFVTKIGEAYPHHEIVAADMSGQVLALDNAEGGVDSLAPASSPAFKELFAGKTVTGLVPVPLEAGPGYALIDATPVVHDGKQVGALALLSPISPAYLEYLSTLLDADLALAVDGQVLETTRQHPVPRLRSEKEDVVFEDVGGQLYAVETFHPGRLQSHGHMVELTASRDVSELRNLARADLYRHLGLLGATTLIVLLLALRYAGKIGGSISAIAKAAHAVGQGNYETAPEASTNDEVESLSRNFNEMVQGLKERDRLKETFGRYVTRQVADHLMSRDQQLGGELVPVTVLFSDIRSFTTISESMPPRDLLDFLNEYFSGMVESVLQHNGVIDKFIGDAIMAVFGAPAPEPDDPLSAVKAALEMRRRLATINEGFRSRGLPEIKTGIGLHYGQVVAGNMGHSERMEYTVIGDTVNLASRLEGMTKTFDCDVLISEDLYLQVQDKVSAEPLEKIKVKGRDQEVLVYRLDGLST